MNNTLDHVSQDRLQRQENDVPSLTTYLLVFGFMVGTATFAFLIYVFFTQFVMPEDTIYGPGYSESCFQKVTLGMTTSEVEKLVGLPLEISEHSGLTFTRRYTISGGVRTLVGEWGNSDSPPIIDKIRWYYSKPGPQHDHYYMRIIKFSGEGKVIEKRHEFYYD